MIAWLFYISTALTALTIMGALTELYEFLWGWRR